MISVKNYPAPNIVAGCRLDQEKFDQLYAWIYACQADYARTFVLDGQWGLINGPGPESSLKIDLLDNRVKVSQCLAVTPVGSMIALMEEWQPPLEVEISELDLDKGKGAQITISVIHKERTGYGPQTNELPVRPANAMSKVYLSILQEEPGTNDMPLDCMTVGRCQYSNGTWILLEEVPPVLQIGAHPTIEKKMMQYKGWLKSLVGSIPQVMQRTESFSDKGKFELRQFCQEVGTFISSHQSRYLSLTSHHRVGQMLQFWIDLSNVILFTLRSFRDRENFNNLLAINMDQIASGFKLSGFESVLREASTIRFDPAGINDYLKIVDQIYLNLGPLFERLSEGIIPVGTIADRGMTFSGNEVEPHSQPRPDDPTF